MKWGEGKKGKRIRPLSEAKKLASVSFILISIYCSFHAFQINRFALIDNDIDKSTSYLLRDKEIHRDIHFHAWVRYVSHKRIVRK